LDNIQLIVVYLKIFKILTL